MPGAGSKARLTIYQPRQSILTQIVGMCLSRRIPKPAEHLSDADRTFSFDRVHVIAPSPITTYSQDETPIPLLRSKRRHHQKSMLPPRRSSCLCQARQQSPAGGQTFFPGLPPTRTKAPGANDSPHNLIVLGRFIRHLRDASASRCPSQSALLLCKVATFVINRVSGSAAMRLAHPW